MPRHGVLLHATGVSWWEAKTAIIRAVIHADLVAPTYTLPSTT